MSEETNTRDCSLAEACATEDRRDGEAKWLAER